jgi:glycosyltransferase involved in cell wall biosynthesis
MGAADAAPARGLPAVTVAVSTHGRAALLPRLLGGLAAQELPADRFEVVIVDDGSPDGTAAVLEDLAAGLPFELRILRHGRNRGAAAGRNTAWRAARAPVVAFTDDDCVPTPGWLAAGLTALEAGEGTFVVGRTEPDPSEAHWLDRPFSRSLTVDGPRFFETCNVFYRRGDLEEVGGLDERFSTGEDTDLGLRMVEAGRTPVWAPDALVRHRVRPPDLRAHLREARHWSDLVLVLRRHPGRRGDLVHRRWFWKRTHPPTVAALAGIVAAVLARSPRPLALVAWWVVHRLLVEPPCPGPRRRVVALPGTFLADAAEVEAMVRGSLRHRRVLL